MEDKIIITGHIEDDDLVAVYNGAYGLVYPSLYEGFGLPIVEAMACGCPVICSNLASMPEVAGDAAILIDDPKNPESIKCAIEKLFSSEYTRYQYVEKALKRAQSFSWEKTAQLTCDVFKKILE